MKFPELLNRIHDLSLERPEIYSVENRNMLNHETEVEYYLEREVALRQAEQVWSTVPEDEKDCYEVSVHLGELDETPRFIVLKKLFKAYKKIYVSAAYADQWIAERKLALLAAGETETEAAKQAKKQLLQQYAIQPVVAYGMFAGYDYAPLDK